MLDHQVGSTQARFPAIAQLAPSLGIFALPPLAGDVQCVNNARPPHHLGGDTFRGLSHSGQGITCNPQSVNFACIYKNMQFLFVWDCVGVWFRCSIKTGQIKPRFNCVKHLLSSGQPPDAIVPVIFSDLTMPFLVNVIPSMNLIGRLTTPKR